MMTHVNFLDPVVLTSENLPLDSLLHNSVYCPASGYDGDMIRLFNKILKDKGVRSFVYCDYNSSEDKVVSLAKEHMRGYRVLAHRAVSPDEFSTPNHPSPNFLPIEVKTGTRSFIHWFIFERKESFTPDHGPDRFSLLYICGEGVSTYDILYNSRDIVPKCVAIVQPGFGFGGNWTDFDDVNGHLRRCMDSNSHGLPAMIVRGGNWDKSWMRDYDDLGWSEYQPGICVNHYYFPGFGQVVVYERKEEFTNNIEGVSVTPDTTGGIIR